VFRRTSFTVISKMAPSYKVHYFDITGRAEPIRMLLSYGGLDFEDVRVSKENWPKVKPTMPLGQLPVLEHDGKLIPQTTAICRYLATKVKLSGNDDVEKLKIDITVDTIGDLRQKVQEWAFERDQVKKSSLEEGLLKEKVPFYLEKLEKYAETNGGYISLERITWADIIFLCSYEALGNMLKKDVIADYPNLVKVKNNVLAVPSIKEWIKKRPTNPMSPFDLKTQL
ncbi:Glutathione S-transferase, partial [Gonioctena quinquepunctata]